MMNLLEWRAPHAPRVQLVAQRFDPRLSQRRQWGSGEELARLVPTALFDMFRLLPFAVGFPALLKY